MFSLSCLNLGPGPSVWVVMQERKREKESVSTSLSVQWSVSCTAVVIIDNMVVAANNIRVSSVRKLTSWIKYYTFIPIKVKFLFWKQQAQSFDRHIFPLSPSERMQMNGWMNGCRERGWRYKATGRGKWEVGWWQEGRWEGFSIHRFMYTLHGVSSLLPRIATSPARYSPEHRKWLDNPVIVSFREILFSPPPPPPRPFPLSCCFVCLFLSLFVYPENFSGTTERINTIFAGQVYSANSWSCENVSDL